MIDVFSALGSLKFIKKPVYLFKSVLDVFSETG